MTPEPVLRRREGLRANHTGRRQRECNPFYRYTEGLVVSIGALIGILDSSRQNRRPEESNNLEASGGQEIDDLLNGVVGAVVGGFEFARWLVSGIWAVMEAAVGERSAQPFVEEEEKQGYLDSFWREAVGVAGAVAL